MKTGLLTIFILFVFAHLGISQNVRVIRASDRSTTGNTVITPVPPLPVKANDSAEAARKANTSSSAGTATKKRSNVKVVRGGSEKKPSVKKVCYDKKNSARSRKEKPAESTKK